MKIKLLLEFPGALIQCSVIEPALMQSLEMKTITSLAIRAAS